MGQSVRASEAGLAIANQIRQRRGWTKTSTARWWQDAHTSRATLRRFWRGERIQQEAFMAICQTVGIENWQDIAENIAQDSVDPLLEINTKSTQIDWGEAPDIEQFLGRSEELTQLQTWILDDRCKLINITGLGGMGKTTLALALAEQLQTEFEGIIWRSLQTTESLIDLLTGLLNESPKTIEQGLRQLLQKMQGRWLIILDDLDNGAPLEQPQQYLEIIHRISVARHQSCLLLTRQQPLPAKFQTLNRVQTLNLTGLDSHAALRLLHKAGCQGEGYQLKALANLYSGNPLALKIVSTTIKTIFDGQVDTFLAQGNILLSGDIQNPLEQSFKRLSTIEKDLLFWLAIWQEPISLCRLQTHLLDAPDPTEVIEALSSLVQQSLITQHFLSEEPAFSLQPMLMTFIIKEMVEAILQEIDQVQKSESIQDFQILKSHCLLRPGTDDILGDRILSILRPRLLKQFSETNPSWLNQWASASQRFTPSTVGYLCFNLTALTIRLE